MPMATKPTAAAAHIPAVADPVSPPRSRPSVIDLTDDSAHPSLASVPKPPPPPTYYTLAEFRSMLFMAEEDGNYSIEEIEKGSLVRSGNSKVEVRGILDTVDVWEVEPSCLETIHRRIESLFTWCTVNTQYSAYTHHCCFAFHAFISFRRTTVFTRRKPNTVASYLTVCSFSWNTF
jgi:hypothetical protein